MRHGQVGLLSFVRGMKGVSEESALQNEYIIQHRFQIRITRGVGIFGIPADGWIQVCHARIADDAGILET